MRTVKHLLLLSVFGVGVLAADNGDRKVSYRVDPEYPEVAKANNVHGTVKVKVWIRPDGTVRRTEYIGGHPLLAESALRAVKDWKFEPAASETVATVETKF